MQAKSTQTKRIPTGFQVLGELGRGAMAVVYLAIQRSLDRRIALKVLNPHQHPRRVKRFLREARWASSLVHPHLVRCYQVGKTKRGLFMALELLEGDAEQLAIEQGGRLPERRALEIVRDSCRGLTALEKAGVTHRDIKPANIFLDEDGTAKLGDLGLARQADGEDRQTEAGAVLGTPAYMAPEQVYAHEADVRCDIYALGATLYRLCTGRPPFDGQSPMSVLTQLITSQPRAAGDLVPDLSPWTQRIISKAMARDPADRYGSSFELLARLERVLAKPTPRSARWLRVA